MSDDDKKATVVCLLTCFPPVAEAIRRNCSSCGKECWLSLSMIKDQEAAGREIDVCCMECLPKRIKDSDDGEVKFHKMGENQLADIAKCLGMPKNMAEERCEKINDDLKTKLNNLK